MSDAHPDKRHAFPWTPPVRYDAAKGWILDANDMLVCLARIARSDEFNEEIAKALNVYTASHVAPKLEASPTTAGRQVDVVKALADKLTASAPSAIDLTEEARKVFGPEAGNSATAAALADSAPSTTPRIGETPRTDAFVLSHIPTADDVDGLNPYMVMAADVSDFARQLERELAVSFKRFDDLQAHYSNELTKLEGASAASATRRRQQMSYCRFSSDDWRCELYCYGAIDGYVTHVASNKVKGDIPKEDWPAFLAEKITAEEIAAQHKAAMEFLDTATREPIGLPHDGESFTDPDLESFLARLLHLREVGYKFPDYVIESVREEIAADAQSAALGTSKEEK